MVYNRENSVGVETIVMAMEGSILSILNRETPHAIYYLGVP
jgi:hypothetical protein